MSVLMSAIELGCAIGIDDAFGLGSKEAKKLARLFEEAARTLSRCETTGWATTWAVSSPTTCSIYGASYVFILPGNTLGFVLNSGRLAGENAALQGKRG